MIEVKGVYPDPKDLGRVPHPTRAAYDRIVLLPTRVLLFGVVMLVAVVLFGQPNPVPAWLSIGVAALILVLHWLSKKIVQRAVWAHWRKAPSSHLPNDWRIDEKGVQITDGAYTVHLSWAALVDVWEGERVFCFMVTPGLDQMLPKRHLSPTQAEDLRKLIGKAWAERRMGAAVDYPAPSSDKA